MRFDDGEESLQFLGGGLARMRFLGGWNCSSLKVWAFLSGDCEEDKREM